MRKGTKRIVVGAGSSVLLAVVCGALAFPAAATGCTTHQCDTSSYTFTQGDWIDENTYETNPINGTWLPYPPNVFVTIQFPPPFNDNATRLPVAVFTYVGTSATPADDVNSDSWTPASGQLALYAFINGGGMLVQNGTCGDYSMRTVVQFAPVDGGGGGGTASGAPPATDGSTATADGGGSSDGGIEGASPDGE